MKKELLNKYKNLKKKTKILKEYTAPSIETENLEKTFPIEVIASIFENRLLAPLEDIEEFASFITNENVDLSNIQRFVPTIQSEILKQYQNLKVLNYSSNNWFLEEEEAEFIKKWYIENNEKYINIKSIKKGYSKVLSIQD